MRYSFDIGDHCIFNKLIDYNNLPLPVDTVKHENIEIAVYNSFNEFNYGYFDYIDATYDYRKKYGLTIPERLIIFSDVDEYGQMVAALLCDDIKRYLDKNMAEGDKTHLENDGRVVGNIIYDYDALLMAHVDASEVADDNLNIDMCDGVVFKGIDTTETLKQCMKKIEKCKLNFCAIVIPERLKDDSNILRLVYENDYRYYSGKNVGFSDEDVIELLKTQLEDNEISYTDEDMLREIVISISKKRGRNFKINDLFRALEYACIEASCEDEEMLNDGTDISLCINDFANLM